MRRFAKKALPIVGAMALLVIGTPGVLMAGNFVAAPEVDPSAGLAALTLVAGAVLVIRGRRKS